MSSSKLYRSVILISFCLGASSVLGQQPTKPPHAWEVSMNTPEARDAASKLLGHCGDADTQDVMNACYSMEFKNSEEQLNSAYQVTLKQLDHDDREPVRVAQRAWLRYREFHCQAIGFLQVGTGSLEPTVVFRCKTELNKSRAKEILAEYRTP